MLTPTHPRLELGCGHHPTPGYTRVDANPNVADLDWCGDAGGPLPFPDESFDEIRAVDVLEHLPYRRTLNVLREWRRLLTPTGRLYVQVPDCGRIMTEWAENPRRWDERLPPDLQQLPPILGVAWRILGGQNDGVYVTGDDDWRHNAHFAMFDRESMLWYLQNAGLRADTIESNIHPNLLVWAVRA